MNKSFSVIPAEAGIKLILENTGSPGPWPRPGFKIKLLIIIVSEKSPIYDNRPCRARAGKPEDDVIISFVTFCKGPGNYNYICKLSMSGRVSFFGGETFKEYRFKNIEY